MKLLYKKDNEVFVLYGFLVFTKRYKPISFLHVRIIQKSFSSALWSIFTEKTQYFGEFCLSNAADHHCIHLIT